MQFLNLIQPQSGAPDTQAAPSATLSSSDPSSMEKGQGFSALMSMANPQVVENASDGAPVVVNGSVLTPPQTAPDVGLVFQLADSEGLTHVHTGEFIAEFSVDDTPLDSTVDQHFLAGTPDEEGVSAAPQAEITLVENGETADMSFVPLEMIQADPNLTPRIKLDPTPAVSQEAAPQKPSGEAPMDSARSRMALNDISAQGTGGFEGKGIEVAAGTTRLIEAETLLTQSQSNEARRGMAQAFLSQDGEALTAPQKTASIYGADIGQAATASGLGATLGTDVVPSAGLSDVTSLAGQVNDKLAVNLEPSRDAQTPTASQKEKPNVVTDAAASPLAQALKPSTPEETAFSGVGLETGESAQFPDADKQPPSAQVHAQSPSQPTMLTTTVGVTQDRPVATLPLTQEPSIESPVFNDEPIEASAPTEVAETETQTTTVPTAAERSALLYASISEGGPQKLGPQEGLSALGLEASSLYGGYESVSARLDQISQADQLTQTNRIELPARLAAQIADVARQLPDGPIEISLSPEELGKVKLTFQVSENGAMNVVVAAERAETLEFMRRNIDSLLAEFSDLGYEGSSFQFQQDGQNANGDHAEQFGSSGSGSMIGDTDEVAASTTAPHTPSPVRLHLDGTSGMDLRL